MRLRLLVLVCLLVPLLVSVAALALWLVGEGPAGLLERRWQASGQPGRLSAEGLRLAGTDTLAARRLALHSTAGALLAEAQDLRLDSQALVAEQMELQFDDQALPGWRLLLAESGLPRHRLELSHFRLRRCGNLLAEGGLVLACDEQGSWTAQGQGQLPGGDWQLTVDPQRALLLERGRLDLAALGRAWDDGSAWPAWPLVLDGSWWSDPQRWQLRLASIAWPSVSVLLLGPASDRAEGAALSWQLEWRDGDRLRGGWLPEQGRVVIDAGLFPQAALPASVPGPMSLLAGQLPAALDLRGSWLQLARGEDGAPVLRSELRLRWPAGQGSARLQAGAQGVVVEGLELGDQQGPILRDGSFAWQREQGLEAAWQVLRMRQRPAFWSRSWPEPTALFDHLPAGRVRYDETLQLDLHGQDARLHWRDGGVVEGAGLPLAWFAPFLLPLRVATEAEPGVVDEVSLRLQSGGRLLGRLALPQGTLAWGEWRVRDAALVVELAEQSLLLSGSFGQLRVPRQGASDQRLQLHLDLGAWLQASGRSPALWPERGTLRGDLDWQPMSGLQRAAVTITGLDWLGLQGVDGSLQLTDGLIALQARARRWAGLDLSALGMIEMRAQYDGGRLHGDISIAPVAADAGWRMLLRRDGSGEGDATNWRLAGLGLPAAWLRQWAGPAGGDADPQGRLLGQAPDPAGPWRWRLFTADERLASEGDPEAELSAETRSGTLLEDLLHLPILPGPDSEHGSGQAVEPAVAPVPLPSPEEIP